MKLIQNARHWQIPILFRRINIIYYKGLLSLALILGLAACSTEVPNEVKPITIRTEPLKRPGLTLPPVDRFRARRVEWIIITPDNANEVFAQLESRGQPIVLFGVTETGYENIALNTAESLRIIVQQQAVIAGYERYYLEADSIISEHNQSVNR